MCNFDDKYTKTVFSEFNIKVDTTVNNPYQQSDQDLLTQPIFVAALLPSRYIQYPNIHPHLKILFIAYNTLKVEGYFIEQAFSYLIELILTAREDVTVLQLKRLAKIYIGKIEERIVMTVAESLIQRGYLKGLYEGQQTLLIDIAYNLLRNGFSINKISQLTGISEHIVRRVQKKYSKHL